MSTQTGITVSAGLATSWASALASSSTRVLKIAIEEEKLVPALEIEGSDSFENDFGLLEGEGVVEDKVPAYLLVRLELSSDSPWIFYAYVPDASPVRSKMLYAATRATLVRSLGDARFQESIFATTKADLTHAAYLSHLKHQASSAPLTAREEEIASLRASEVASSQNSTAGRSIVHGASMSLSWSQEATEAVRGLSEGVVLLKISSAEEVVLASVSAELSLPLDSPVYAFCAHARGIVFIYSCPPSSPIESRLVYSSSSSGVVGYAKTLGISILKKIETSDPAEVDAAFVEAELGPVAEEGENAKPMEKVEEKAFARPSRPGRKR